MDEDLSRQFIIVQKDPQWLQMSLAEARIAEIMDQFRVEAFDENIEEIAWSEFENNASIDRHTYAAYFKSWFYYSWPLPSEFSSLAGISMLQKCLREHSSLFTAYEKKVAAAIYNAPFSFFLVQNVTPDQKLFLQDIMRQNEVVVKEHTGTHYLHKGQVVLARVVTVDEQSVIVGMAPFSIPNDYLAAISNLRIIALSECHLSQFKSTDLGELDFLLRMLYFSILNVSFSSIHALN